ncbi:MAG: hypothetical protein U9N04_03525, partial [Patescibacteria group bacterium]|nr:hypothetical protein [Patescibacteria group bacterium]
KRGCDSKYRGWDILKPFWELSESFSKIVIPIRCDFMRTVPGRHSPLYSKYRATILAHIEERSEDIIHSASYGMYYIRSDKAKIVANDGKIILSKETGRETLDEIENPFHSYNKKWEWEKSDQFKEVVSLSEKRNDLEKSLKKLLFFKEVVEKAGRVPNFLISWKPGRPKYGVLFRELRKNHPKGQAKRIALEEIEKYREETEPDFVSLYNRRRAELAEVSAEIKKINLVVEAMREEEEEEEKKKWKQEVAAFLKKYSGVPIKN